MTLMSTVHLEPPHFDSSGSGSVDSLIISSPNKSPTKAAEPQERWRRTNDSFSFINI